ncbi:alpha/beta hydrolase-fold protein [Lentilactobacillus otakiensis]|uniref:Esterase n=1 Tax=Lentilactobacillus otakiensis DSM 19908 = JCM 15040 TaxID=1423780 RepID=S4NIZ0_9LACO|nr:alpha/beta hydrolase-fold protein [Lentilactobacillus otakiensis]KRL10914.1 esterase [Lentilactobacillus otakiensis DSM 19908 = JCM 15040]MBZ3777145.1 acetyl esterase [Lentilactobacillus otakiensis]MDV3517742.1 alpha/beta hydrolase-fold protein [Lentilactobacillus otakiensis]GAD17252.1 esterase [Lentilactobacillus otakiensis DSM 19908 = JCM 15040]
MAILSLTRAWSALEEQTTIHVILPNEVQKNQKLQVLWLLHGLGDNGSGWIRKTNLEVLIKYTNLAVITPEMNRSFYMNLKNDLPYWDYLTQEVIPEMRKILPLSTEPKDNFVGGASMGGFGALKLAFTHPDWFSAVMPMSPVVDLTELPKMMPDYQAILDGIRPQKYLENLAESVLTSALRNLRYYYCIGDQDVLKPSNDQFVEYMKNDLGLDVDYYTGTGAHDWLYWQKMLPGMLTWLLHVNLLDGKPI